MRVRETAKTVVHDPDGRVLLLRHHYPYVVDPANPTVTGAGEPFWAVPGGGVQNGESFEQAARRELWEETGIGIARVDRWLWSREKLLLVRGEEVLFQEQYFLVRLREPVVISRQHLVGDEREALLEMRWCSVDDVSRLEQRVSPPQLLAYLRGEGLDNPNTG